MRLYALLLVPLLTGCLATRGALKKLGDELDQASAAVAAVQVTAANPDVTQAELDAAMAKAAKEAGEAKAAAEAVPGAMREDFENLREEGAGVLGAGMGVDGGAIGLALTGLAWWLRDRRKKAGKDPLQRADISTPPVVNGPA